MRDLLINKIQTVQRCVRRAREEYEADPATFDTNYSRQDAAILNILRACESAIGLANHLIRVQKLGVPVTSADSFRLLAAGGVLDARVAERMIKMIGFRNTVVHQYTDVSLAIVRSVLANDLDELIAFTDLVREACATPPDEPTV